jgi:hypothetical protein
MRCLRSSWEDWQWRWRTHFDFGALLAESHELQAKLSVQVPIYDDYGTFFANMLALWEYLKG